MRKFNPIVRIKDYFSSPRGTRAGLWTTYFLYWASLAPFILFVALYFESIHLSGSQIGMLSSIRSLVSLISSVLLAFLTDVLRRRKMILRICMLGMAAALFIFPHAVSFITLLPVVVLYSIFLSPTSAILDETTLRTLENPRDYSKIRLGGSIGWGVLILFTGWFLDQPGVPLAVIFDLHIILLVVLFIFSWLLPNVDGTPDAKKEKVSLKDVWEMLRLPAFLPWMGIVFLWGVLDTSIMGFLFLHIKHLGGDPSLMGISMSIAMLGEIVGFSLAKRIQRLTGSRRMMLFSLAVLFIVFAALSTIKQPAWLIAFMVLGGGGFTLMQAGSVAYVNQRAPERIGTTAQAVRSGFQLGMGSTIGALISGALYQAYGSVILYRVMAVVTLIGFLLALLLRTLELSREKNQ